MIYHLAGMQAADLKALGVVCAGFNSFKGCQK
jgi:hypothetical protein